MFFFFFNDTATTEIYTLSLHDALPICAEGRQPLVWRALDARWIGKRPMQTLDPRGHDRAHRSEEHTSELQSPCNLVCRLLLEKKKTHKTQQWTGRQSSYKKSPQPPDSR